MRGLSRRDFIKGVAAGLGGAALEPLGALGASRPSRPNVLVVLTDQHRWQSLPFTETPELVAPNLARMASEGFSFDNCISNYPLCSPSRGILLTGRWPQQTGVVDNSTRDRFVLPTSEQTVARVMKAAGYETGYIGKWHLGRSTKDLSAYGFDSSIVWSGTNDHWDSSYIGLAGKKRESKLYNATHMTNQALAYIADKREQPFFLVLALNPPHSNYTDAPARFASLYWSPESMPLRKNVEVPDPSLAEFATQYRGYHAHVSAIDHELGRLLEQLDTEGILDETLVVYLSDHGDALGSHNHIGKRVPYAEAVRIPFLVRWPGHVSAGASSMLPVGTIDWLPTVCGLLGIPVPEPCAGADYSHIATPRDGSPPESQLLMNISDVHPPQSNVFPTHLFRGIATERHTYAVRKSGPWLLFDNETDPLQLKNVVDQDEYYGTRVRLHALLSVGLAQLGDDFLEGVPVGPSV